MATISIYPALGVTVDDENGDPISTAGITVTLTDYYNNLLRQGLVLTYDPLGTGLPVVGPATYYDAVGVAYTGVSYVQATSTLQGHLIGIDNEFASVATAIATGIAYVESQVASVSTNMASGFSNIQTQLSTNLSFNIRTNSSTSYTVTGPDFSGRDEIRFTSASGCIITVPSGIPTGYIGRPLVLLAVGSATGLLGFTGGTNGSTINTASTRRSRAQFSKVVLEVIGPTEVDLNGDLSSA